MDVVSRALALVGSLLLVGALAHPAQAHATYRASSPAKEESVPSAPSEIWVEFTEQPTEDSKLEVFDPCGERVDSGRYEISVVPSQNRITTSIDSGRRGVFRVDWSVLSNEDGHPTAGSFTFTSAGGDPCPGATDPRPDESSDPEAEPEPEPEPEPSAGSDTEPEPDDKGGGGNRGETEEEIRSESPEVVAQPSLDPSEPQATPTPIPTPSDLPMGSVVTALVIALMIGASGGVVYRGLMGPPS